MLSQADYLAIRLAISSIPGDVSNDAVGAHVARIEELFAPDSHAVALDPTTPVVVGARGSGKSFWSGALGQESTLKAAAKAYPKLGLERLDVRFGYTGIPGPGGVSSDAVDSLVPPDASLDQAKIFWWGTIIHAMQRNRGTDKKLSDCMALGANWEDRENILLKFENELSLKGRMLLIVYDAVDTVARTWPRRRLLTEALFEVVWAMRAYRNIRVKIFIRPDQINDDSLRFVELPKLRAGAARLTWSWTDLYGLLFSRVALNSSPDAKTAFHKLLMMNGLPAADQDSVLTRRWSLATDEADQKKLMSAISGPFMGSGVHAYKKGITYDWPLKHSADAFSEVTPRSFLGLMVAAAKHGAAPIEKAVSPDGIRHGLREASKTRVDQLHQEFPWIKGVLAPMAGLLLPQEENAVFDVWRRAKTVEKLIVDAEKQKYLLPFKSNEDRSELGLFSVLEEIGIMFRRKDGRLDMPDLFRVAARLLKKGGITPIA